MRIERIDLKNYRQFKDISIKFDKGTSEDLHVFIANNATGKTNILNAINWCLYGNEPHLSKDSQQLPRLNLNTMWHAEEGAKEVVCVEIQAETEGNRINFKRSEDYQIHGDSKQPAIHDTKFVVTYLDEKKNAKWVADEEAASYVARFVPQDIREFFFFDGERLDTYFRSATGQQISNAIFRISQVDTLNRISDRLENIVNDLQKEAGKRSPQIEQIRSELEAKQQNCKDIEAQIAELIRQKEEAREKTEELNGRLRNIPDIEELQKEQEYLEGIAEKKEQIRNEKVTEKRNILFEYGVLLKLYPSLEMSSAIIQDKVKNKEIPQTYDNRLLDSIISTHQCICLRPIEKGSSEETQITKLRDDITQSSLIAQELLQMMTPIEQIRNKISKFSSMLEKITKEIETYDEELNGISAKIQDIDGQIGGYNAEQVKQWYGELKRYKDLFEFNSDRISTLKVQKESLEKDINDKDEELKKALRKEANFKELRLQIDFGTKASVIINKTIQIMMDKVRKEIESETKTNFLNLIWKKGTYRDVYIDESYSLHLVHTLGYECLGTVSASERQLLALSFVIALHNVSGFDSPILVDTPAARVSGEQRENLGKIFQQISKHKQLILLFLPTEYSTEISKTLDQASSCIRKLRLTEDEREIQMEVLH